ncbi:hypothetical protein [Streptomyces sp. NPDC006012]|uniref:hypothetical protein n=1 Tax=Streptomyces sp. NPDC006012 TaxID=3364739 RepID=UPI0036804B0E
MSSHPLVQTVLPGVLAPEAPETRHPTAPDPVPGQIMIAREATAASARGDADGFTRRPVRKILARAWTWNNTLPRGRRAHSADNRAGRDLREDSFRARLHTGIVTGQVVLTP